MVDINPFDGDGIDFGGAVASAAALAALGLMGRKGYTGLRLIGNDTLQQYFKGVPETEVLYAAPAGKTIHSLLTGPDAAYRDIGTGVSQRLRTFANKEASDVAAEGGLVNRVNALDTVVYGPRATIEPDPALTTQVPTTNLQGVTTYQTVKGPRRPMYAPGQFQTKPYGAPVQAWQRMVQAAELHDQIDTLAKTFNLNADELRLNILNAKRSTKDKTKQSVVNVFRQSGINFRNPEQEEQVVKSITELLPAKIRAKEDYKFINPNQTTPGVFDPEMFNDPVVVRELEAQALKAMGSNMQVVDRIKNAARYLQILNEYPEDTLFNRLRAQRKFLKERSAASRSREYLSDAFSPAGIGKIAEVPYDEKLKVTEIANLLGIDEITANERLAKAYGINTAGQKRDETVLGFVDKTIRVLKSWQNRLDELRDMRSSTTWPVVDSRTGDIYYSWRDVPVYEDPKYLVDPNYVSKVGYVKKVPPMRAADFVPSAGPDQDLKADPSSTNSSIRMLKEGLKYPTKDTIIEDEKRAMAGKPPLEEKKKYVGKVSALASSMLGSTKSKRKSKLKNDVVVDLQDTIKSLAGGVPTMRNPRTIGGEMKADAVKRIVADAMFDSGTSGRSYDLLRRAGRNALTEGAANLSRKERKNLFFGQARQDLREGTPLSIKQVEAKIKKRSDEDRQSKARSFVGDTFRKTQKDKNGNFVPATTVFLDHLANRYFGKRLETAVALFFKENNIKYKPQDLQEIIQGVKVDPNERLRRGKRPGSPPSA